MRWGAYFYAVPDMWSDDGRRTCEERLCVTSISQGFARFETQLVAATADFHSKLGRKLPLNSNDSSANQKEKVKVTWGFNQYLKNWTVLILWCSWCERYEIKACCLATTYITKDSSRDDVWTSFIQGFRSTWNYILSYYLFFDSQAWALVPWHLSLL